MAGLGILWAFAACRSPETIRTVTAGPSSETTSVSPVGSVMRGSNGPTTEDVIVGRLRRTVAGLPAGTTLQRISMADVAYPRTEAENVAMGGYALLLVTSVTHQADELPLARAVVRNAAGQLPLERAAMRHSELVTRNSVRYSVLTGLMSFITFQCF
jgi:hypothetical protein